MNKKLYKSNTNRMLAGVCGGIAEYFNLDPTVVRLAWLAGIIDREEAMSPRELLPLFRWDIVKKENISVK